ncbi:universal stress protein [Nesterenkonia sp. F]|uniref:universal stress protein n=1 Tax=Nesterenkonia sp. F TaxID=795955 RepID=UPI000255C8BA|nr:universal stress protein [Nesterenkonia sp. F]
MSAPIIVGVDGSETARKAAEQALELARALGAELKVISAYSQDRSETIQSGSDKWVVSDADNALHTAEKVVASLDADGVTVTPGAEFGRPAEALLAAAEKNDAQMIVVGNQRIRGMGRVLGSIATSVAHNADCDVHIANTYTA